ncbi:hypothetical protein [Pleomorphomonas sp. PLEO]|uniref:hypothetical protein n=1 Tax=Pleomorphomonas sp. PLEO TaxID=3239306 RepID=UPI00351EF277
MKIAARPIVQLSMTMCRAASPSRAGERMDEPDGISRSLGRVEGTLQQLIKSAEEDRASAADWRRSIYHLLQDHADEIGKLREDVVIVGEISTQAREHAKKIEKRLDEDISPDIAEWRKIKAMGMGMFALVGLGGAIIASTIAYFWDVIAMAIRSGLKIH